MAYIGKSPTGSGVRQRYVYTATGGETSLSGADDNSKTLQFTDGEYVDVHLNGIQLVQGTDYGVGTANTINGLAALAASDVVEITVYDIYSVAKVNAEAIRHRWYFTASGGETSITTSDITGLSFPANAEIEVRLNGISLVQGTDFNTTTANTVGGLAALSSGNVIEIIYYEAFQLADVVSKAAGGTYNGQVIADGGLDMNGKDLILDADADSKIEASTDDTINIISGGTTGFTMNSAGVILQPTKPMFDVRGVAGQSITSASFTKVQFNNEQFDIGGYYDPTTNYRYTPLVAGKYFIYGRVYITYVNSAVSQTLVSIYKNGTEYARTARVSNTLNYGSVDVSAIIDFNGTTDYVEIYAYQVASSDALIYANSTNGAFSGYLIG